MTKNQRLVLLVAILASFISIVDGFIVNVALPTISKDLGGGLVLQQWVVDAYILTLGSLMLIAGSLSDIFGRRKILQAGLGIFLATSLLCALSPNGTFLVIARALQGIGGALIVPSSLALIISAFSGAEQGRAIGRWTGWSGIATIAAPFLGGILVDSVGWQSIFLVNVIPLGVTMWLLTRLDSDGRNRSNAPLDIRGAVFGALGLGGIVYAFIEQSHYGWRSPLIYGPLALGVLSLLYFIRYEQHSCDHPMLPMGLFKVRNFSIGNIATLFVYAGLSVSVFTITVFVQQYAHYSALDAGLMGIPATLIMFFLAGRFGGLAGKLGPRLFMGLGPIVAAAGFGYMLLATNEHVTYWSQILPGYILFGLGLSATVAPLTSAILGCISPAQAGIGSATNNAVSRIAGLVGIALLGLFVGGSGFNLQGFKRGLGFVIGMLVVGGLVSLVGIQNKPSVIAQQH